MTDLYDEWYTQRVAIKEARTRGGRILISGLGLGLIVDSILDRPAASVEKITVLENSMEVIRLVGAHLQRRHAGILEILRADVFRWEPPTGTHYSVIWHDIWPNPYAPEAVREMEILERRYESLCDWQRSWPREYHGVYEAGS